MRFTFVGKNIAASDAMKERTTKKLERLAKLLPPAADIFVTFSVVKHDNIIEVSIPLPGKRALRAQVAENDWFIAIDKTADLLERQLVRFTKRFQAKKRRDGGLKDELDAFLGVDSVTEQGLAVQAEIEAEIEAEENSVATSFKIDRVKTFALKPMDEEEAVMEMELLGHIFFVFRNSKTDEVNVVYKRNDGSYGLICPSHV